MTPGKLNFQIIVSCIILFIGGLLMGREMPPWDRITAYFSLDAIIQTGDITAVLGVKYGPAQEQYVDLYYPQETDSQEQLPLVVLYPGGGFNLHEEIILIWREYGVPPWVEILIAKGVVFCICNYRKLDEMRNISGLVPARELAEDAVTPVRMFKADPGVFGIDPARIGVVGDSAGGWMASRSANQGGVAVAVLFAAMLDLSLPEMSGWIDLLDPGKKMGASLSPVEMVGPQSAPTMIVCGQEDIAFTYDGQQWPYFSKLLRNNVYADWLMTPGSHNYRGESGRWDFLIDRRVMNFLVKFLLPEAIETISKREMRRALHTQRATSPQVVNQYWNPICDLDWDGKVTARDIELAGLNPTDDNILFPAPKQREWEQ